MDVARVRERHHELELEGEAPDWDAPVAAPRRESRLGTASRARDVEGPEQQVPSCCASARENLA